MTRTYMDCRENPDQVDCTLTIAADREDELLAAAAQHAVAVHKYTDGAELRKQLRTLFQKGIPA